jgi:transposase
VATIVRRAVEYGLRRRASPPVHVIGIDEESRRKGQVHLTVVYDLERRVLLWVGEDRTETPVRPFFTKEMGRRRCHTLRVVCMDMWAPYANLVQEYATKAQLLSDRSRIVKHINEAAEKVRRELWRQLTAKERTTFTNTQMLRSHLNGIPPWTKAHVSNGADEGTNNKSKSFSHRSFGLRTAKNFIAAS